MITSDTNFRGNFDSIEAVWEAIPYGGVEGDYLNIQGVKYRWNKYLAMWENAEVVTETPARETVTFDEDVNMQNDLTVAGVLRAKEIVAERFRAWNPKGNYDATKVYSINDLVYDTNTKAAYLSMRSNNIGHPVDENDESYEEGWWMEVQTIGVPKGDFSLSSSYNVGDIVYDSDTNSSYLSLRADNMGHAVTDETWWMKVVDGSYVNLLEEELQQLVDSISEGTQQQVEELNEALEALEAQADQSRQDIQDIVDSLAVVQTTGQSASDVMSQKAVTDEICYKIELVSHIEQANGYINGQHWKTSTSYYGGWVNIQAYKGKKINITAGSIRSTGVCLFKRKVTTNNEDLTSHYANGWSSQVAVQPSTSAFFVVPDDAQYLYVLLKGTDSQNATPSSIEIIYDNASNNADYLRAPINIELTSDDFEQGAINAWGVEADNATRIKSRYIYVGGNYTECNITGSNFKYSVYLYDKDKNYIGCLFWWQTYKFMDAYYIKFVVGYTNDSAISMADIPLITITSGASVLEPKEDVVESDVAFLKYQNYNHNGGTLNFTADDFETGGIAISGINDGVSDTRARSKHYIDVYDCDADVYLNNTSYSMYVFVYDESKTLLTTSGAWVNNYKATGGRYIRIAIRKGNGSVSFSPADINWTDCYIKLYPTGSIAISSGIIYPYMEVFKSIPSTEINEEFQSFCKVGNEFWIASGGSGDDQGSSVNGYIYRYDSSWNYIARMQQTVAHWNSMSYDPTTDRLITGQMGSTSNKIYVFGNVSQWPTTHASTAITSSDIERTIIVSQVNNRPNPVWAERNALGHRDIIISGNLNSVFLKIRLGYGTNQLSNGTYTASANGVPNGTYDVLWNIPFTPPAEIYAIAAKIPQYPTAVCQGIDYYKGRIYSMSTVTPSTILELTPNGNMMDYRIIHQLWSDDSGNAMSNCANEGIMCLDGKVYVGVSAIGTTTTITQYNNKILRFDL